MSHNSQNILNELQLSRLPTLPHILVDILNACQDSAIPFEKLTEIVSRDAAIAARAVSMANSTFFNRGTPIRSLDRALLLLGTDTIKTIVITTTVHQFFSGINSGDNNYLKEFWRRSLSCALLAKSVAILTSYPQPDEAYLCGLLHNIGELVLATNYPKQFNELSDIETESSRLLAEQKEFTIDHAELGAVLVEDWGLSPYAADAIRFHHETLADISGAHHLVKILFMSSELSSKDHDIAANSINVGDRLFELNPSLINEIVRKINQEVYEVAQSIGIRIGASDPSNEQLIQLSLSKSVRDQNLLRAARSLIDESRDKLDFTRQVKHTLSLLFGTRRSVVFWNTQDRLELVEDERESTPINFSLDEHSGLVAKSALMRHSKSSFHENSTAVVDQQILRLLDSKGMLCMPLVDKGRVIAVVVSSLHSEKEEVHPRFLQLLLNQFTEHCIRIESANQPTDTDVEIGVLSSKAAEIAHEANNPLSIINNYLSSLSNKLADQHDVQEDLMVVKEELERASQIILRLRDLQQDQTPSDTGADVNMEIQNLLTLYKNSLFLAKKIAFEYKPDHALEPHLISRNCLRQILTNLMKNAVEALPEGGKISVATKSSVNVSGKNYTEIVIEDNGPGIPEEIQKNLFTPVSTTKGTGHSGLGLSITKNLVTEARGTITCRSNNTGTQFQILLPNE